MPKNTKFIALRKKAGFPTRYALTQVSGISEAHLRQIEQGAIKSLQLKAALALASALKIELAQLGEAITIRDREEMLKDKNLIMNFLMLGAGQKDEDK